ncbi:MAG: choice-of-anchor D domain-containing protein [Ignavibacteria bacterium]|nr:choice-of-anchor D domain-containing protein [Ignavibacteria bacterium]
MMARTGSAGTGEYTVCIYAKSTAGGQLAQACMRHSIVVLSPPTLVSPSDGEKLPPGRQTTFTWLPATPTPGNASYDIRIVEVMGAQTPVEAMKKNNPFYHKDGLNSTMHVYPASARPFVLGNTYAWQVTCGSAQSEAMAFKILVDGTTITLDLTPLPCMGCCFEMKIGGNFTSPIMDAFHLSCTGAPPTILSVTTTANTTIVAQQPNSVIIKHSGGPFVSGFVVGTICFQNSGMISGAVVAWSTNGGTTFMNPPDIYSIPCPLPPQSNCAIQMGVFEDQNPLAGPLDFGTVPVNSSSSKLVTLKNTGTSGELIVSPLALSLPPFTCAFVSTSGTVMTGNAPYTAYTLLPNQIVTYSVTFNPTTVGAHTKTWYVAQNSANYAAQNPFPIQLTGSGTSPACPSGKIVRTYVGSVAAANDITNSLVCDFGTQTIGSYVKTVIIKNTSAASCGPITITPAALSGGQSPFSTTGTTPSGGWTIAPGGTKEFLVHYDCILGPNTQTWAISHTAGNIMTPYEIVLQGTGISGQTHTMKVTGDATTMAAGVNYVHNSSYDFGNTTTAVPKNKIFKIWSYGDASLLIETITITPVTSPFTLLTTPPPPWTLAVNLSGQPTGKAFTIRYLPTATGSHAAQLNISNNSTNNPTSYVINLTGECTGERQDEGDTGRNLYDKLTYKGSQHDTYISQHAHRRFLHENVQDMEYDDVTNSVTDR